MVYLMDSLLIVHVCSPHKRLNLLRTVISGLIFPLVPLYLQTIKKPQKLGLSVN
jgi:hypothetical protein